MRAAVTPRYGPPEVVQVRDVPDPRPGNTDVLVRVHASAVTAADSRIRGARFPRGFGTLARLALGLRGPRRPILGSAFSGVVEAVGSEVAAVSVGDEVCGMTGARMGAHAELVRVPAAKAVPKPAAVSHRDAAAVLFGGTTAMDYLHRKASVQAGQRVLVVGGSGAVGSIALQLAVIAGAHVSAVTSGGNAELARSLGATDVIDYTSADVTAIPERFDLIVDTVGTLTAATGRPLLAPGGVLLLVAADLFETIRARGDVRAGVADESPEHMARLLELLADGSLTAPIDLVVPLEDIVTAHTRVDAGHKVGNVLVIPTPQA